MIIHTHSLTFAFNHHRVLNDIDLDVPTGSIFGFLGPNGAGKSTTIKSLLGLLQVEKGMVELFGMPLEENKTKLLARIGAMVESPSLYDHLNARRNLEITRRLRGVPASRIEEVLEIVGLTADAHRLVRQYSTGMKQRLSLAIALLGNPELLILDEPINGLDPSGIIEIRTLLQNLNRQQNCTIFLSSHILDEIEKLCTHVGVIQKGRILYQGGMEGLLQRYSRKEVLLIRTSDNKAAAGLLKDYGATLRRDEVAAAFTGKEESAMIIRTLVESAIQVYEARLDRSDLEDSFLKILEEGGENEG